MFVQRMLPAHLHGLERVELSNVSNEKVSAARRAYRLIEALYIALSDRVRYRTSQTIAIVKRTMVSSSLTQKLSLTLK
jgi:hypothetical protein